MRTVIFFLFFTTFSFCYGTDQIGSLAKQLSFTSHFSSESLNFLGVHDIFWSEDLKSWMLVVRNVPGYREKKRIQFFSHYSLLEFPESKSTFISIALVNISALQIDNLFNVKKKTSLLKQDSFLQTAYACSSNSFYEHLSIPKNLQQFSSYSSTDYWGLASSCLIGLLQGAWESTGGLVNSATEGFKALVDDPKKFWDDKVASVQRIRTFFVNFEIEVQKIAAGIKKLPDEVKAEIFCSFAGSIGTDILIGILSAGAGIGKVALSLPRYLTRISKIQRFLASVGNLTSLPKNIFKKIARGMIKDSVLDNINRFTLSGLNQSAYRYAKCAI